MLWKFLDSELEAFAVDFPELPETALAMAPVADFRHELLEEERGETEKMAEARQLGFSSGRYCAHLVQAMLGLKVQAIGRADRAPVWPDHSMGSITHSATIAAALASTHFRSVGIDIEQTGRVEDKLHRMLFTEAEQARLKSHGFDAATVVFSAKEAGYKSIYPLAQTYIGFQQAEIRLEPDSRSFTIDYIGEHVPNRVLNSGRGYWREHAGHVMTVFVIS